MFSRVLWIVLDSVGIGQLEDAAAYGDAGAATLQNMAKAVGGLYLPQLEKLGLGCIEPIEGIEAHPNPSAWYGKMAERSIGKDTTTGHWEMAGIILSEPFVTFPNGFPPEIVDAFVKATGRGVLGNKVASGTQIIEELGPAQLESGDWILYTSADSVFQLAAHEDKIGLDELYQACQVARQQLDAYRVGRVIARPFVGQPGSFQRTYHRHDYSMKPNQTTILTELVKNQLSVVGVGKIADIFAAQGISESFTSAGNQAGMQRTLDLCEQLSHGLIFVNLVDFDMLYGHRRNPQGYYQALQEFDAFVPSLLSKLQGDDLLLITADHGCDPTYAIHTDHTREYVPLLVYSPKMVGPKGSLGVRQTFADLAATVAQAFGIAWTGPGTSVLGQIGFSS